MSNNNRLKVEIKYALVQWKRYGIEVFMNMQSWQAAIYTRLRRQFCKYDLHGQDDHHVNYATTIMRLILVQHEITSISIRHEMIFSVICYCQWRCGITCTAARADQRMRRHESRYLIEMLLHYWRVLIVRYLITPTHITSARNEHRKVS